MNKKIISLSEKLIKIKSIEGNEKELEKILDLVLDDLKEFTIEKFEKNGIKSALVYNTKKRPKKFKIILNGHLDVIPGKDEQYKPIIKGNKLYGVGAMDMKSNIACAITAFQEVASKVYYPLALQLVTDEEVGGFYGTKHQVEKGVRADFILSTEPTNFDIVNESKGVLWIKISTKGKTAHGAYPWRGENAILKMNKFINELNKKYKNPKNEKWSTTINLSSIKTTNTAFNKIPSDCSINLDIRYIPKDKEKILKDIKTILPKGFKIEVVSNEPPLQTQKSNEYIKLLKKSGDKILKKEIILRGANGSSDARHFSKVNCPGIEFGPIGKGIGSDNEWVDIKSLDNFYKILTNFLLKI